MSSNVGNILQGALRLYMQYQASSGTSSAAGSNPATITGVMQPSFLNPPPETANPFGAVADAETVSLNLKGVISFAKVGAWDFSMNGPLLNASFCDGRGDYRLEYWVAGVPTGRTFRLLGLDGSALPVVVQRDVHRLWCRINDLTTKARSIQPLQPHGWRPA